MKKIACTFSVLLMMFIATPVFACPVGNITGGACSIKDIAKQEQNTRIQKNTDLNSKKENNLRPVASNLQITNQKNYYDMFGMSLNKTLSEKSNELK